MIRRYNKSDYHLIASWYLKRGLPVPPKSMLPRTGFIVDDRVAGFLYLTDGNIALVDGLISDPDTIPAYRTQSLEKLCGLLIDTAVMYGYTNILAATTSPSVKSIAKKLSFKATDYELFLLKERSLEDDMDDEPSRLT